MTSPTLSIVIPVFDERDNIVALVDEVSSTPGLARAEIVCVDDCSSDDTLDALRKAMRTYPLLRVLSHDRRRGQSAALRTGVRAAHGEWIATLDGDGQNVPADIPALLAARDRADPGTRLVGGWRVDRRDDGGKRIASRIANGIRARVLRDDSPDTGCGIKLFEREAFLDLPAFDHMHRYLPALMQRAGWTTLNVPVRHRPRTAGRSKYTNLSRALAGALDLAGVLWLIHRGDAASAHPKIAGRHDGPDERRARQHGLDRFAPDALETDRADRRDDVRPALASPVPRHP